MVNKYTFEVSYHKTIMADTLDNALDVLQDKEQISAEQAAEVRKYLGESR